MVLLKNEKSKDENYILLLRNYKSKNIVDGNISHIQRKKENIINQKCCILHNYSLKMKRRLPHTTNLCGNLLSNNLHWKNIKRSSSERRQSMHIRNSNLPATLLVNMYTVWPLWNIVWSFFKRLKIELVFCCCWCSVTTLCSALCDSMASSHQFPCSLLSPGVCSSSHPLSQWCHPAISSSVTSFSSYPQSSQHQILFQ